MSQYHLYHVVTLIFLVPYLFSTTSTSTFPSALASTEVGNQPIITNRRNGFLQRRRKIEDNDAILENENVTDIELGEDVILEEEEEEDEKVQTSWFNIFPKKKTENNEEQSEFKSSENDEDDTEDEDANIDSKEDKSNPIAIVEPIQESDTTQQPKDNKLDELKETETTNSTTTMNEKPTGWFGFLQKGKQNDEIVDKSIEEEEEVDGNHNNVIGNVSSENDEDSGKSEIVSEDRESTGKEDPAVPIDSEDGDNVIKEKKKTKKRSTGWFGSRKGKIEKAIDNDVKDMLGENEEDDTIIYEIVIEDEVNKEEAEKEEEKVVEMSTIDEDEDEVKEEDTQKEEEVEVKDVSIASEQNCNAIDEKKIAKSSSVGWFGFRKRGKSGESAENLEEAEVEKDEENKEENLAQSVLDKDEVEKQHEDETIETSIATNDEGSDTNKLNEDANEKEDKEVSMDSNQDNASNITQKVEDTIQSSDDVLNELVLSIVSSRNDVSNNHTAKEEVKNSTEVNKATSVEEGKERLQNNTKAQEEDCEESTSGDMTKKESEGKEEPLEKKSKGGRKRISNRLENALNSAFPWRKSKSDDDVTKPASNETDSTQTTDSTETTEPSKPITQPASEPSTPPPILMPMTPSSPFIFIPPPPPPRSTNRPAPGMPIGPISPREATVTSLISSLLPLVVRLALLTMLSSSSLFGHGDMHVHSPEPTQHFVFERINDRYEKDNLAMKKALEHAPAARSKSAWKFVLSNRRNRMKKMLALEKANLNSTSTPASNQLFSRTVIVMDVETTDSDMDAVIENLRDSISCILRQYRSNARLDMGTELEVVVRIESPGGIVSDFGIASDQLTRLKDAGMEHGDLILTVCVDKIAASGGYMMACQASPGQLVAAPFSILGSIGVLRETINVHDVLEKYGVRPLLMTAGAAKAPLTSTTKVTEESLEYVQKNLDRIHEAFRDMVSKARGEALSEADYEKVTSGDVFLAKHAIEYGLVDRIMSSDEYIAERVEAGDRVLRIHKYDKNRMGMRFSPLDLLLLKSNGLMGKAYVRRAIRWAAKVAPVIFKASTTIGLIQVLDKNYARTQLSLRDI